MFFRKLNSFSVKDCFKKLQSHLCACKFLFFAVALSGSGYLVHIMPLRPSSFHNITSVKKSQPHLYLFNLLERLQLLLIGIPISVRMFSIFIYPSF